MEQRKRKWESPLQFRRLRTHIRSLAPLSGLRLWRCRELRCRSQARLHLAWLWRRGVATAQIRPLAWELHVLCDPKKKLKKKILKRKIGFSVQDSRFPQPSLEPRMRGSVPSSPLSLGSCPCNHPSFSLLRCRGCCSSVRSQGPAGKPDILGGEAPHRVGPMQDPDEGRVRREPGHPRRDRVGARH